MKRFFEKLALCAMLLPVTITPTIYCTAKIVLLDMIWISFHLALRLEDYTLAEKLSKEIKGL